MPSAKYALALSSLRFSKGKTAIDFSRIIAARGNDCAGCFNTSKYTPVSTRIENATILPTSSRFLFKLLSDTLLIVVWLDTSCSRCATSAADCGRCDGSFARQAATVSSQTAETNVGAMSSSFRRSVIEG